MKRLLTILTLAVVTCFPVLTADAEISASDCCGSSRFKSSFPSSPGYYQNDFPSNPGYIQNDFPSSPGYIQDDFPSLLGYVQDDFPSLPGYVQDKCVIKSVLED